MAWRFHRIRHCSEDLSQGAKSSCVAGEADSSLGVAGGVRVDFYREIPVFVLNEFESPCPIFCGSLREAGNRGLHGAGVVIDSRPFRE